MNDSVLVVQDLSDAADPPGRLLVLSVALASSRLGLADIMGHARNLPPAAALCVTDEAFARPLVGEGSLGVDLVGLLGGASSAHSP